MINRSAVSSLISKGGYMKKQKYKDKKDESMGMKNGKQSTKKDSMKTRRKQSYGMKRAMSKKG
jgi:hypothetical protein